MEDDTFLGRFVVNSLVILLPLLLFSENLKMLAVLPQEATKFSSYGKMRQFVVL